METINRNEFDRIFGRQPGMKRMGGMLDNSELDVLASLINHYECRRILEIGVNTGGTAKALLSACKCIRHYYGIDRSCFESAGILARDNRKFHLIHAPEGSRDKSIEWDSIPGFDLVFIDGNHHYIHVKKDDALARRLITFSGKIVFHDYIPGDKTVAGVKRFVDELDRRKPGAVKMVEGTIICFYGAY